MAPPSCVGCVVLRVQDLFKDGAKTAEMPFEFDVLMVELRWSRRGFKSGFHELNGADPLLKMGCKPFADFTRNCTDEELSILMQSPEELWALPSIPESWKQIGSLSAARQRIDTIHRRVEREIERRQNGGIVRRDKVSSSMLVLPKGLLEESDVDEWAGARRELAEEAGINETDIQRIELFQPYVTVGHKSKAKQVWFVASIEKSYHEKQRWDIEGSTETKAAVWFPIKDLPKIWLPKAMGDVLHQVIPDIRRILQNESTSPD